MKTSRLAALAALALVVTGCGSSTGSTDGAAGDGGPPPILTVWQMGPGSPEQTTFLDGVEAEFRKNYPNTDVVIKYVPWSQAATAFQKAAAGGEGPDVTEIGNTDVQSHIEQGNLADISAEVNAWPEGKDLNKGALANDQANGKTYAVPWYGGVRAVWYRKDWFAELNIAVPKSWPELVAAARKIQDTKKVPGIAAPSDQTNAILSFVWANGGDIAAKEGNKWVGKLADPKARQALEFYTGLVRTERVAPDKYVGKNELQGPQQDFALGQLGMYIDGSWALPELKQIKDDSANWGTFPVPGPTGGTAPVFSGGSDLAIWQTTKSKKASFDYITVLNNKRNAQVFADSQKFLPQFTDLLRGSRYASDPLMSAFATAANAGVRFTPTSKGWADYEQSKKVLPNAVKEVMQGASVETACKQADQQAGQLLNP
ncbi:carbohydrate ABC transporter substrate-binding protein (CUT1 family) [Herbihabitans rhizosphaerae]|uniref:Carbohydrate ABC transporter substrate-binding protein (CUT1 family) n=1 Tax=Herbihabitans rhizosphaerae TaxID=1872711 RepID=A0A4Q7KQU1_9PSEU|nr:extracellular solute-binding protein [Herbihabitans rhizosphaerae]RZS39199.1 carbohydrate ABC transporter substrate-binding protein (CUT1 family) [Herbihabitans rhizosphaerae]